MDGSQIGRVQSTPGTVHGSGGVTGGVDGGDVGGVDVVDEVGGGGDVVDVTSRPGSSQAGPHGSNPTSGGCGVDSIRAQSSLWARNVE